MRELPILFSAPMVRAILEGRKTVARRAVKPMPGLQRTWLTQEAIGRSPALTMCWTNPDRVYGAAMEHPLGGPLGFVRCPYGEPGDRLWVREATEADEDMSDSITLARFRADGASVVLHNCGQPDFDGSVPHWRAKRLALPGIHMPKAWARIWLEVTDVRVERLHRISETQAKREGLIQLPASGRYVVNAGEQYFGGASHDPREVFSWLWNDLATPGATWADNPWVWVVEFRRVEVTQ